MSFDCLGVNTEKPLLHIVIENLEYEVKHSDKQQIHQAGIGFQRTQ